MVFNINGYKIEVSYNEEANMWFAKVSDDKRCYYRYRRLREGVYPFFNGITARIDYRRKDRVTKKIDDAIIDFYDSLRIEPAKFEPCDEL